MPAAVGIMADSHKEAAAGGIPMNGLAGWWDAADTSTITPASGAMTQWRDKSGNVAHAGSFITMTTGTRVQNGNNVVDMAYGGSCRTPNITVPVPLTVILVLQSDQPALTNSQPLANASSPSVFQYNGKWALFQTGGSVLSSTVTPDAGWHVITSLFNGSGTPSVMWYDGTQVLSAAAAYAGWSNTALQLGNPTFQFDGGFGEVLLYNRALTTPERQQVESYLTAKWITPSSFSPLSIPWHSAFWASDPTWIPPADGAAVSSWRNAGTSAANATQGATNTQPTYRAAYAGLNNKPALQFDGTDGGGDVLWTTSPTISQPTHVFGVAWLDATAPASATLVDGVPGANRQFVRNQFNQYMLLYAGTQQTIAGPGGPGPYAVAAMFNQASSALRYNGTVYAVPGTVGASGLGNLAIGGYDGGTGYVHKGAIAFVGVIDRALTTPEITNLEAWAKTFYGVPIP
jgi:hypothetical protein